ncbi:MAG: hypothetical protein BWY52_00796 [Chloroflexi bacterium ADurb.Bin325]|nr:MAG: hypothetical protein BWY52_00796 [Chloroflexi bacterium ADurb.Bin325]
MHRAPSGEKTIQFRAVLPPAQHALPAGRAADAAGASALALAGAILRSLRPLQAELDAALARDDHPTALRMVYRALLPLADAFAAYAGCPPRRRGQARAHALMVELEPLPLAVGPDGTLVEQGAAVTVHYRNWQLAPAAAARWAWLLARLKFPRGAQAPTTNGGTGL